jgi:hypothetical protein
MVCFAKGAQFLKCVFLVEVFQVQVPDHVADVWMVRVKAGRKVELVIGIEHLQRLGCILADPVPVALDPIQAA